MFSNYKSPYFDSKNVDYTFMNIEANNNLPPWCKKNIKFTDEVILDMLNDHYKIRSNALIDLMNIDVYNNVDIKFIDHFYDYFHVNLPCLCNIFINENNDLAIKIGKKFGQGKVGQVFNLEYYDDNDERKELVLKKINNVIITKFLNLDIYRYYSYMGDINKSNEYNKHKTTNGYDVIIAAYNDDFSNQTCLHMILNIILGSKGIDNYIYQYDAFYCSDDVSSGYGSGYNIIERANGGDLDNFLIQLDDTDLDLNNIFLDMLQQIFLPLRILKNDKYGFIHGDLKTANVFVHYEDTDNRRKTRKPIFKIADYDKSSIFWNGIRFFSYRASAMMNQYIVRENDHYYMTSFTGQGILESVTGIRLPAEQLLVMHSYYAFYSSYDFYTFYLSLMLKSDVFYDYIIHNGRNNINDRVYRSWRYLWMDESDYANIMYWINNYRETKSKQEIRLLTYPEIMRKAGVKLRYDINEIYNILLVRDLGDNDKSRNNINEENKRVTISKSNHLCKNQCSKGGKCDTNRYIYKGFSGSYMYEEDNC